MLAVVRRTAGPPSHTGTSGFSKDATQSRNCHAPAASTTTSESICGSSQAGSHGRTASAPQWSNLRGKITHPPTARTMAASRSSRRGKRRARRATRSWENDSRRESLPSRVVPRGDHAGSRAPCCLVLRPSSAASAAPNFGLPVADGNALLFRCRACPVGLMNTACRSDSREGAASSPDGKNSTGF